MCATFPVYDWTREVVGERADAYEITYIYNRVFAITFDEAFAQAVGLPVGRYNLVIAIMVALVIVVGMNLVGALLLSALVVFPALSAMRVCRTFKAVTIFAAVIGVLCAMVGMLVSIVLGTPVGSTIVVMDALAYAAFCLVGWLKRRCMPRSMT